MSRGLDRELLAEKAGAVERHLRRVQARLPASADEFEPASDASDAVVLHLWQATQLVIDVALSACLRLDLGAPPTYADAFDRLAGAGIIDADLRDRLVRATGFRNVLVHAYEQLDLSRVHAAAQQGPQDLRRFLAAVRDRLADDGEG
ncbi:MAG TPA: DUF86 domain-containing protein [Nitriliruptorales bacterium]